MAARSRIDRGVVGWPGKRATKRAGNACARAGRVSDELTITDQCFPNHPTPVMIND